MKNITKENEKNLDTLLCFLNGISKEDRKKFFYKNRENMDTLVWYYCNEFTNEFHKDRKDKIEGYLSRICEKTGAKRGDETKEGRWWIHTDRVLGIYWREKEGRRIGIECVFKNETYDKKLGEFHIYIASWEKDNFSTCEDDIRRAFPDSPIDDKSKKNRAIIPVAVLDPDKQEDAIISTLEDTYNKLKKILDDHQ